MKTTEQQLKSISAMLKFLMVLMGTLLGITLVFVKPLYMSPRPVAAPPPPQSLGDYLLRHYIVEPCCESPVSECIEQKPECVAAPRIAKFVQWMEGDGQIQPAQMVGMFQGYVATLTDTRRFTSNIDGWPVVGDPNAPITIVMYLSMGTCPASRNQYREIVPVVTSGILKGKAKVVIKSIAMDHVSKGISAAHELGHFTDYVNRIANINGPISEDVVYNIAVNTLQLNRDVFKAAMESPALTTNLEQASAEARQNGVVRIPTYFIDGRLYSGFLTMQWITDAVEFAYEMKSAEGE